jgi:ubiquinol-cytochrome c reductase cytochrome c1 subunit
MKRFILLLTSLLASSAAWPAGEFELLRADVDLSDQASLQRGARIFVNYCQGCHSAAYMRYSRLGSDLGITDEVLKENLMFGTDKPGDTMTTALNRDEAVQFFGIAPPDLSVTARARGADWLYTYFMTFYRDDSRPMGVNNLAFKDVAMPHVLWKQQGWQRPVIKETKHPDGSVTKEIDHLELETPGELNAEEYTGMVRDLVNFLVYLGEPIKLHRYKIGGWVMVYLLVLLFVVYLLKQEYWKDVR